MKTEHPKKPQVAVVAMSKISKDVRVVRHLRALMHTFDIVSVGYGPKPECSSHHIQIPDTHHYLPLTLTALVPHALGKFDVSSQRIPAIQFVAKELQRFRVDAILLNDVATLPLLSRAEAPAVVDMHEFAPLELEGDWRFNMLLRRYNTWLCRKYLPIASVVTTVSDGLATRYEKEFAVDVDVIYNAREKQDIQIRSTTTTELRLIHTGLAAKTRQLDVMIRAVASIPHMTLDMFLVKAPYQGSTLRKLTALANKTSNVRILPPVDSSQIPKLINGYDLSLIYISDSDFTLRHAMPNKLFDSIQARTGVVTGPSDDLKMFCVGNQIGISTDNFSAVELGRTLRSLDISTINRYKENAEILAHKVHAQAEGMKLEKIMVRVIAQNPSQQ